MNRGDTVFSASEVSIITLNLRKHFILQSQTENIKIVSLIRYVYHVSRCINYLNESVNVRIAFHSIAYIQYNNELGHEYVAFHLSCLFEVILLDQRQDEKKLYMSVRELL